MVGVGEKALLVPYRSGSGISAAIFPYRLPKVGDRVLIVHVDGKDSPFFIKPYRSYKGDQVLMVPINGNPDNVVMIPDVRDYMPPSWQGGFGMICQGQAPTSSGWTCQSGCPRNPDTHPTPGETCKLGAGIGLDYTSRVSCTHDVGRSYWQLNHYYIWDYTDYYYNCKTKCLWKTVSGSSTVTHACAGYGIQTTVREHIYAGKHDHWSGNKIPAQKDFPGGCYFRKQVGTSGPMMNEGTPAKWTYSCFKLIAKYGSHGETCTYYPGVQFPVCTLKSKGQKGPEFSGATPTKPCRAIGGHSKAELDPFCVFDGWISEGNSASAETTCIFGKASETVDAFADDNMEIRCKFMSPTGATVKEQNI